MIRSIQDFTTVWKQESASTSKLLNELTDDAIKASGTQLHRDIGKLAWHITTTVREMMERTGLKVDGPDPHSRVPASAKEIAPAYALSSASLVKALDAWTDKDLDTEDNLYGEPWKRSLTLQILLFHQTHHRGQMTVLMRQAGLPMHGMYGPTKEDWGKYGMPIPEI